MSLVRRLSLLLALEGVLLALIGGGYAVAALGRDSERAPALLAGGAGVVTGLLLLLLARAVDRGKGWARSPAVVLNIFPFPLALAAFDGGAWWVALPLVGLAGGVLYLFATPELRLVFRERG